jgi:hypothetical protein
MRQRLTVKLKSEWPTKHPYYEARLSGKIQAGFGSTPEQAIGQLVRDYPAWFGVALEIEGSQMPPRNDPDTGPSTAPRGSGRFRTH